MNQEATGTKKRGMPRKTRELSESPAVENDSQRKTPETLRYIKLTTKHPGTLCPFCNNPSRSLSSPTRTPPGLPHYRVQYRACNRDDAHRWATWFYIDATGAQIWDDN